MLVKLKFNSKITKMIKYIVLQIILLFFLSCNSKVNHQNLLLKAIDINKITTPIIAHRTTNNTVFSNNNIIHFYNSRELIQKANENFYSVFIKENKNTITIGLENYKTGFDYYTIFDKRNNYKIIKNEVIQLKRGESKPYYIYFAILRKKDPNYMNWKYFKIPEDSLK